MFCTILGAKSSVPFLLCEAIIVFMANANATDRAATSTTDPIIVIVIIWSVVTDVRSSARTQFIRESV